MVCPYVGITAPCCKAQGIARRETGRNSLSSGHGRAVALRSSWQLWSPAPGLHSWNQHGGGAWPTSPHPYLRSSVQRMAARGGGLHSLSGVASGRLARPCIHADRSSTNYIQWVLNKKEDTEFGRRHGRDLRGAGGRAEG